MGNPPFVGYSLQGAEQKQDILSIYVDEKGKPYKTAGKIDYVAGWYYKAAQMMSDTHIKTAFVSTNSICQGEQVAGVWKPLYEQFNIQINFAHTTFKWNSEASEKAAVHCVIVGFSHNPSQSAKLTALPKGRAMRTSESLSPQASHFGRGGTACRDGEGKYIYTDNRPIRAENINPYLIDAPDIVVESRSKPLCCVPRIIAGNKPVDGDFLKINKEDYDEFISKEPKAKKYIKKLVGGYEFIKNEDRYVLWLLDASPSEIKDMPLVYERVKNVREARLNMKDAGAIKLADTPTTFRDTLNPENYIVVPIVSSENRKYVPMGFLDANTIPTNQVQIIPDATIYHFGVLTSNVHMSWMRAVCGRLKSDYRYTGKIVYNNFPWCSPTEEQKAKIEQTAQAILDARALYPDCSLADLYDELTMPPELRRAHQENDRAVMKAYGFDVKKMTESDCVAELMKMYQALTEE